MTATEARSCAEDYYKKREEKFLGSIEKYYDEVIAKIDKIAKGGGFRCSTGLDPRMVDKIPKKWLKPARFELNDIGMQIFRKLEKLGYSCEFSAKPCLYGLEVTYEFSLHISW